MSTTSPTAARDDEGFVCECAEEMRSACQGVPFYSEYEGKSYCVLHYPGAEKGKDNNFEQTVLRKYHSKNYDFRGVYFPNRVGFTFGSKKPEFTDDADFTGATFDGQVYFWDGKFHKKAKFDRATFNSYVTFKDVTFIGEAEFNNTFFKDTVHFDKAHFTSESSFQNTEFRDYAYFTDAVFSERAHFLWTKFKANTYFTHARFEHNATFTGSQFSGEASFSGVDFRSNAYLNSIDFNDLARFSNATFSSTTKFDHSEFNGNVNFTKAKFQQNSFTQFINTIFHNHVRFVQNTFDSRAALNFTFADFEKPERVLFNSVTLHPYWFLSTDSRKFSFVVVTWSNVSSFRGVRNEIKELTSRGMERPHQLLAIACRNLAVNAEENNRYEEAANFRYMAMEVKRLQRGRKIDLFHLSWWYWLLSGYGERVTRAFGALLVIWLLFAVVYSTGNATWWQPKQSSRLVAESIAREQQSSGVVEKPQAIAAAAPLAVTEAVIYSAGVMSLQKPEPLPANNRAKVLVLSETIFGPLQAALLALAIRRKFMR
ncbi:MAG: pentapeptide repeat-containing protein [Acidobacteria bacterium]|nr:pentapeptide repeat-containing protein [Acidobacteriota bacterium]